MADNSIIVKHCYKVPILPVDPEVEAEIEDYFYNHHQKELTKTELQGNTRTETKGALIKVAAALLLGRLSHFREDYPKTMPVNVFREIKRHNEKLRLLAIEVRRVANTL